MDRQLSLRSSAYIAVATVLRAVAGLVILKIVATTTTVAEFGKLTQLVGVFALVGMTAVGGAGSGVTRGLSFGTRSSKHAVRISAARINLLISALLCIVAIMLARPLSESLWGAEWFALPIALLGIVQAIVGIAAIAQSEAVATREYPFVLRFTALGVLIGAVSVAVGSTFGLFGAALGLLVNLAAPGLAVVAMRGGSVLSRAKRVFPMTSSDVADSLALLRFGLVPLAGAISLSLGQIAVREVMAERVGWEWVGYWQAVSRLSDVYLQLVSALALGVALPAWVKHASYKDTTKPLVQAAISAALLVLAIGVFLWMARDLILPALFATEFKPAGSLIPWQVAGDVFRASAVAISTAFLARGSVAVPMLYEFAQGGVFFALSTALLPVTSGYAPVIAYFSTYVMLALVLMALWYWRHRVVSP